MLDWLFGRRDRGMFIDLRRVNDEDRVARRSELHGDVVYRNRVKQRMREGYGCVLPPLYRVEPRVTGGVVRFERKA